MDGESVQAFRQERALYIQILTIRNITKMVAMGDSKDRNDKLNTISMELQETETKRKKLKQQWALAAGSITCCHQYQ